MIDNLSYSYTAGTNRLASITNSVGSATQTYTYDANGNATSDSYRGIGFIVYDINNLPVTVYKTSGATLQYYYDATGNRIQKYDGSANTWYVLGADGKTEVITTAATTAPTYTMDNLGQILRNGTTLTRYYYLKDHLGSIKMMVDASGNVQSYNDYYPYGMTMPGRSGTMGADTRFRFTGKERDVESGFDYFGARYYDSRIGRFLTNDPHASHYSNLNPYHYCGNNPIAYIDPTGMDTIRIMTQHPISQDKPNTANTEVKGASHTAKRSIPMGFPGVQLTLYSETTQKGTVPIEYTFDVLTKKIESTTFTINEKFNTNFST